MLIQGPAQRIVFYIRRTNHPFFDLLCRQVDTLERAKITSVGNDDGIEAGSKAAPSMVAGIFIKARHRKKVVNADPSFVTIARIRVCVKPRRESSFLMTHRLFGSGRHKGV
jgi:hypothetical protein